MDKAGEMKLLKREDHEKNQTIVPLMTPKLELRTPVGTDYQKLARMRERHCLEIVT